MSEAEVLLAKGRPHSLDPNGPNRWRYKAFTVVFDGKKVSEVTEAEV